jgi:hypothetical protein
LTLQERTLQESNGCPCRYNGFVRDCDCDNSMNQAGKSSVWMALYPAAANHAAIRRGRMAYRGIPRDRS